MSSGSGNQQTNSTELPAWMQPYAKSYLGKAQSTADKPYTEYGGQTVAGMDPRTQQGIDAQAQLAQGGTTTGNAGSAMLTDTLSGKYLNPNSNPNLTGQIDAAQGDVIRNYNLVGKPQMESAMARSGSFGNSGLMQMQGAQQGELQRNLGRISSDMRSNAYGLERGAQQQALGLAPQYNAMQFGNAGALQQAGGMQQAQQQAQLDDSYRRFMERQGWDAQQLGVMGQALGNLRGTGAVQTQSGQLGPTRTQSAAAGALAGSSYGYYGAAAGGALGYLSSDRRLKTDIKRVGKTDEGLGVYTYRYKAGGPVQMGVMAQEVEKMRPEAVARDERGFRAVNYGLLG